MEPIFKKPITVVTGFPRSGTTLMMLMLEKAGIPIISDTTGGTEAGFMNVRGNIDADRVGCCQGCAIKLLDPHINILPTGYCYRFIFMERNTVEQAKSQLKLLRAMGMNVDVSKSTVRRVRDSILRDRPDALRLLRSYPDSDVQRISFEELLAVPVRTATLVCKFLNIEANANAMAALVKQRSPECAPDMSIELEIATKAITGR